MDFGRLTRATRLRSALLIGSVLLGLGLAVSAGATRSPGTLGPAPPSPTPEAGDGPAIIVGPDDTSTPTPTSTSAPTGSAPPTGPAPSTGAVVVPPPPKPGAPTGLTAVAGDGEAQLCWHAAANASSYALFYQDITVNGGWTALPYPVVGLCFTVQLLWNSHHYQFRVRGGNTSGSGPDSNTVDATPQASLPGPVTGLTATSTTSGQVKLCWSAAANADGYAIDYRDVTQATGWATLPYPVNDVCFTVSLLVGGDRDQFRVRGGNLAGPGPESDPVTVTVHI